MIARCCETTVDAGPVVVVAAISNRQSNQKAGSARRRRLFLRISIAAAWPRFRFRRRRRMLDDPVRRPVARGTRREEVGRGRVEHAGRTAPFAAESVSSNCRNFNAGDARRSDVRWVITTYKLCRCNKKLSVGAL